jgi:uncharacterized protein (TIGR02145 family)
LTISKKKTTLNLFENIHKKQSSGEIMKNLFSLVIFLFISIHCSNSDDEKGLVKDKDGNVYHTVIIGRQTWMVENLKTSKYRNGDPIQNIKDKNEWGKTKSGAFCSYENADSNIYKYGLLYNYYAVKDERQIAPKGYHVASIEDWDELRNYVKINSAGDKLKEKGFEFWSEENKSATNEVGFSARGAGCCSNYGSFRGIKYNGYWWTSSEYDSVYVWSCDLSSSSNSLGRNYYVRNMGFSVRCIKD